MLDGTVVGDVSAVEADLAALLSNEQDRADRKAAQSRARAARAAARSALRAIPPQRSEQFAHLSLDGIRAARATVSAQEEQVGYWLRIFATRLDAIRGEGQDVDVEHLRPALVPARLHAARRHMMELTGGYLPELPALESVWVPAVDPAAEVTLATATEALATYREALIARMRAATQELIARYRQTPQDCLSALQV